jgi:Ricin-type beta-trefoil lectin domain-like
MNKRRIGGLLLGSLIAAALGIGVVPAAQAAVGGYHELVNVATRKCADVSGRSTRSGALVHEWDCAGEDHQVWGFADLANGYYHLANKNSNLCFDVQNGARANGTPIVQRPCFFIATQQWQLRYLYNNPEPDYVLINRGTGKCLDLNNADPRNGTPIQIWDCVNLDSQFPNLPGIAAQVWALK